MKKETTLTQLLGITQLDAAMLLGVTASRWSMYSSGKRDLPTRAMVLLAEMLAYVKSAEANVTFRYKLLSENVKPYQ
jgi:predicted transcriptional regulator